MDVSTPSSNLILPGEVTVATLPSPALYTRRYMWVTDLHDNAPDYVLSDGTFWKPVRPLAVTTMANANSNMTFQVLKNAPTQVLQGTLSAVRTMTLSPLGAYKGARFRMKREASGLLAMVVAGVNLGAGQWADYEFDGTAWVQTASGGLL